jgi:hypothetical protein
MLASLDVLRSRQHGKCFRISMFQEKASIFYQAKIKVKVTYRVEKKG